MSVDSYMDRTDGAAKFQTKADPDREARFFRGALYPTMIARNVAEAKWRLNFHMTPIVNAHKLELRNGVPMGCDCSQFQGDGKLKPEFRSPL
jgi:hypothetical protein